VKHFSNLSKHELESTRFSRGVVKRAQKKDESEGVLRIQKPTSALKSIDGEGGGC
jgi:hypothetical protein